MTRPRMSEEWESGDVLAVDAQIEALRSRDQVPSDPAFRMLADLRDDIDGRTATLLGRLGNDEAAALLRARVPASLPRPAIQIEPTQFRRRERRRRLVVLPIAGALVLGSTGVAAALSGSRQATFYPLHQLIFGSAPSSDARINQDLAEAGRLLDQAAALSFDLRGSALKRAQVILTAAAQLLPSASSSGVRERLAGEIALVRSRVVLLAQRPQEKEPIQPVRPRPIVPPTLPESTVPASSEPPAASTSSAPAPAEDGPRSSADEGDSGASSTPAAVPPPEPEAPRSSVAEAPGSSVAEAPETAVEVPSAKTAAEPDE